ncbi:MAG: hypothetical protein CVU06_06675 [Bacteroidetes bacterium HGW-Bacteroidetes-22]|nr:MAG: hypothetical protein CVU06_06675 [Bacteroidetes bacterium HGW-Bacteroidetes-22]
MLRKSYILIVFVVAIIATSCVTTHKVDFEVMWPAKAQIPPHIRHLTLVNNTMLKQSDSMGTFYGFQDKLYYDTTRIDTMLSMSALDGLAAKLTETDRYTLSSNPVIVPLKDTSEMRKPMLPEVLGLITPDETEGVVVLESISTYDQVDYYYGFNDVVNAQLTVLAASAWRMYDLTEKRIVDRWVYIDTLRFYGDGYTVNSALNPLPGRYESLRRVALAAGERYSMQISPFWLSVSRLYLSDKSGGMEKGRLAAEADQWETASAEWQKLTENKSNRRAAMACFNMAVASEVLGNLVMARYWLDKSVAIKQLPQAARYNAALKIREKNLEVLKRQFGE